MIFCPAVYAKPVAAFIVIVPDTVDKLNVFVIEQSA
jgi:hypothetical protein